MTGLPPDENRPPGRSGQAASDSWERVSTRINAGTRRIDQLRRSPARLEMDVQAPARNLIPALIRRLKQQLAEDIVENDDATAERLRARLDLNEKGGR
jgi:hypothetical protein